MRRESLYGCRYLSSIISLNTYPNSYFQAVLKLRSICRAYKLAVNSNTATILETIFALTSGTLMHIFTDDPTMIALVGKLLAIDIALEIGRVTNLVYGQALKTSGDAIFPTIIGATFMYLCMVGGTYFFGIHLGLLVVGAYIGMASDECVRAVCMYLRWKSGKWKSKGFL